MIVLHARSGEREFVRWSDGDGHMAAFAIENGRIHSAPIANYVGAEEGRLEQELSSLAGR